MGHGCLICGKPEGVKEAKHEMIMQFECHEVGKLKEYVGCKVDQNEEEGWIKLTQPVLMQSYVDEFDLSDGETLKTPVYHQVNV